VNDLKNYAYPSLTTALRFQDLHLQFFHFAWNWKDGAAVEVSLLPPETKSSVAVVALVNQLQNGARL
jgi:hypothetical protein